jgi:hypothetical protein
LTRPKQYGLAQGGVAMNSSFQINIYHGTFLENLSYWVLVLICRNLIKQLENFTEKVQSVKKILNFSPAHSENLLKINND